ncbi:MAG: ABC transporter ATP-binding protein [Clostridiaceae bacterium]|nr:ABC transporter ATP-binding protein [Clostridiaceae bacterium]
MLEIKNLNLEFDDKPILKNINLKLEKGKIYGLIGPNGVGKTSLIKCLTGIYEPNNGEVLYDGNIVYDNVEVKKNIAYVPDENNFFSSFKITQIIEYYKYCYENFNEEKLFEINKYFKIGLNKKYYQLSKGMKMKTCLMLALAQEADYIILDEPTAGLDPIMKNILFKLLEKEMKNRDITIIISSHHLSELERICDDVILIADGEISYENTLDNMKKRFKKLQFAFDSPLYEEDINIPGIIKINRVGRVFTVITDNYDENFKKQLNKLNPLFVEEIDLNLEDLFVVKVDKEGLYEQILQ